MVLRTLKGKEAILDKVVFEVRYRYGFGYLDNCGSTVNRIMRTQPEWILRSDSPNPQNAPLISLKNGCLFNFSALKYDFGLDRPIGADPISGEDFAGFADQVNAVTLIVHEELQLKDFTRVGFRAWFVFPFTSKEESESWLLGLGCYEVSPSFCDKFEGKKPESTNMAMIIKDKERNFRFAFNGVEQQAQMEMGEGILSVKPRSLQKEQNRYVIEWAKAKRRQRQSPGYAAMIDVDAFIDDPLSVDARDFIVKSMDEIEKKLEAVTS